MIVENEGREQEAVAVAGVTVGSGHRWELLSPFFPALTGDAPPSDVGNSDYRSDLRETRGRRWMRRIVRM